jgi:metal-responsive CopG/Arc/MetJ family transcriptional regulator
MDEKVWVSAQITKLLEMRLRAMAHDREVTRSEIIRRACELYLAKSGLEEALDDGFAAWIKAPSSQAH